MSMTSATIFPVFERFRDGVAIAAKCPADKFLLFLTRVVSFVDKPSLSPFDATEAKQLEAVLGLSDAEVRLVVQFSLYVFERAALFALKAQQLLAVLGDTGLPEAVCTTYATVWAEQSATVLASLRASSAVIGAPLLLEESTWRLSLGLGSSAATHVKDTSAVFDLHLRQVGASAAALSLPAESGGAAATGASGSSGSAAAGDARKVLSMEFSRAQLVELLEKLDTVQEQIDALSS